MILFNIYDINKTADLVRILLSKYIGIAQNITNKEQFAKYVNY